MGVEFLSSNENAIGEKADLTILVHDGADSALPKVLDYARATSKRIALSVCTPVSNIAAQNAGKFFLNYAAQGQPRELLETAASYATLEGARTEFSNPAIIKAAFSKIDLLQVWSPAVEAAVNSTYISSQSIHISAVPSSHSESVSAQIFTDRYQLSPFILCVAPICAEGLQLALASALEDVDIPLVCIGTAANDLRVVSLLQNFKRSGKTIVIEQAEVVEIESAIAACRVLYVPNNCDGANEFALHAAFLGRSVVCGSEKLATFLFAGAGSFAEPANLQSSKNALRAAFYGPFDFRQRESSLKLSWLAVSKNLMQWLETVRSKDASELAQDLAQESVLPSKELPVDRANALSSAESLHLQYLRTTEREPANINALVQLLGSGLELRRYNDIEQALRRYNSLRPSNVELLYTHAVCLEQLHRPAEAYDLLQEVLRLAPTHSDARNLYAQLKELVGKKAAPLSAQIVKTVEAAPRLIPPTVDEARTLRNAGEVAKAIELLNIIVASNPRNSDALCELGTCVATSGNYESATELFEKAFAENPTDRDSLDGLLYSSRATGNLLGLVSMLERVVETPLGNVDQRFVYAQCLVETGSVGRAREQFEVLQNLAPQDRRTRILRSALGN